MESPPHAAAARVTLSGASTNLSRPALFSQFAGEATEVVRSGGSPHNKDGRTVHPGLEPARSVQVSLKIFQFVQQHEDIFTARCEICGAGSTMCSQPPKLRE